MQSYYSSNYDKLLVNKTKMHSDLIFCINYLLREID